MSNSFVKCLFCDQPINVNADSTLYLIRGWARRRSAGGVNQLRLRSGAEAFAHDYCVKLQESSGIAQEAFL